MSCSLLSLDFWSTSLVWFGRFCLEQVSFSDIWAFAMVISSWSAIGLLVISAATIFSFGVVTSASLASTRIFWARSFSSSVSKDGCFSSGTFVSLSSSVSSCLTLESPSFVAPSPDGLLSFDLLPPAWMTSLDPPACRTFPKVARVPLTCGSPPFAASFPRLFLSDLQK